MESVEDFMRRLFDEKVESEKERLARIAPFRQKFFTPDCDYGTRPGVLEQFQSERVQSISVLGTEAEVITTQDAVYIEPGSFFDMRYLLRVDGDRWLIYEVDVRCCSCEAQAGKGACPCCHGSGWRNTTARKT